MDARLASTKEVDLKSKVQSDFYRDERKRVSDRATGFVARRCKTVSRSQFHGFGWAGTCPFH